ncbi:hypothetical protein DNU06_17640 [Putridiphycobacter roseus]|uniref:Uncharacterized protein n=2 Tax=Putridiphycobacter roseus TaxID=2219161 RepID=A0A2W1NBM7_9FLAO|nr:hypothetical protein DNU06_17640 [Putridiphycobacter roseus]
MMMHYMGMMHTCTVHQHEVQHGLYHQKHVEAFQVPSEWTMFIGEAEKSAQHGVFLKKVEGKGKHMLAMKTVHGAHSVEIHPEGEHGEHYKILVDGKEIAHNIDYHTEDWFALMVRPHIHGVVMTTFHYQLHMEYVGDKVIIEIPKVHGVQFYGHCLKH